MKFVTIALILLVTASPVLSDSQDKKLAIIASGSKESEAIASLMYTKLSSLDDVVLLERKDLNKILSEQGIALQGLLSTKDALNIGALLKCDILAEIHCEKATANTSATVSIVTFDLLTGVRLCDKSIPPTLDLDKCAGVAAETLYKSLAKWQGSKIAPNCITLSFVSLRHSDMPANWEHIPRTLRILLERRMLSLPNVSILERQRLNSVLNESSLTGLRLDRLMGSFVLIDIDIAKGAEPGTLSVKLILSDGKGKSLGTISAANSPKNISTLMTSLIEGLVEKLKLVSPEDIPSDHMFEAERFLAEAFRYELRGYKKEASLSEASARTLTEATLEKTPKNFHAQKTLCRLLIRELNRQRDPLHKTDLLRRCLGMAVNWPADNETPLFVQVGGELLHNIIKELRDEKRIKRIADLRVQFGEWARNMDKENPSCVDNITTIEAWSTNTNSLIEGCSVCLTTLPSGLGVGRYTASSEFGTAPEGSYLYKLSDLSGSDRKKLLDLYGQWGKTGNGKLNFYRRMQSHICAAMLANSFKSEFKDWEEIVRHHIREALKLINDDPTLADLFLPLSFSRGDVPPSFYTDLPHDVVAEEVQKMVTRLDADNIATPLLLVYLDEFASDKADYPGAYLKKAWAQLDSPDYLEPSGDILKPEYVEWYMKHIQELYHRRYGGDITGDEVIELRKADLKYMNRIFDFDSIQGISSIESAELKKEWLYILCLHSDPKMYELRRVNVKTGIVEIIGEIGTEFNYRARTGNEIHIGENTVYVPTDKGLICCDINTGKTWSISEAKGLPATTVSACLEVDDNIYIGLRGKEEGYLVKSDLKGDRIKVLASSGRKEKNSGLDDCQPYIIESMVFYQQPSDFFNLFGLLGTDREILLSAMFLEPSSSDQPWMWKIDLNNDSITPVHTSPYHAIQLRELSENKLLFHLADVRYTRQIDRKLSNGKKVDITLREPSQKGARGYGFIDLSSLGDSPVSNLKEHATALIGTTDPEKLRIHYNTPNFCGRMHIIPSTTSAMCLLNDSYLVSSSVRRTPVAFPSQKERYMQMDQAGYKRKWQIIPRNDTGDVAMEMPLLDDEAPFMVRAYNGSVIACTQEGVWKIEPQLLNKDCKIVNKQNTLQKKSISQKDDTYGKLEVNCPLGSIVTIDKMNPFNVWKGNKLTWNKLNSGEHQIDIKFLDKSVTKTIHIKEEKVYTVNEWFGRDKLKTRKIDFGEGVFMEFVWVPFNKSKYYVDKKISFGDGFWMGKYEVTQEQYEVLMGNNPSKYLDKMHPVSNISRTDADRFCKTLMKNCSSQLNGLVARLPSDQEWNYACSGGKNASSIGDDRYELMRAGWVKENSDNHAHPAGEKMPNLFWLYDMHGNVAEWCEWGPYGQAWASDKKVPRVATGMRVVLTPPDSVLGRDADGWMHLTHIDPIHAKIGWGTYRRYKKRDSKPPVGYGVFHTVMYCHANSSIKYKLDGKYNEFQANFGLWNGAHGVCRFVVVADGKEIFKSGHIYGIGGSARTGTRKPIKFDITGVDILELKTVKAEGKSLANACGMWADAKVK